MTNQAAPETPAAIAIPPPPGMAKNRKPNSPPANPAPVSPGDDDAAGDFLMMPPGEAQGAEIHSPGMSAADGDITLDDYEDRQQQRPRLPDQRREKKSFEMSSSVGAARESATGPSTAATDAPAIVPATADEIESFDPLAAEGVSAVSRSPKTATAPVAAVPVTPGLDDLEEFIARAVSDSPAKEKTEKVRRPLTLVEKICSLAGAAVVIAAAVWLITSITSEADGQSEASAPWPDLPMEGSLVTITEASSNWRRRAETDRVAQMEIILPVPGLHMPEIIPQVTFTIDSGKSSTGFLRFIFKDTEGKPRGDTRVVHVEGGKLKSMNKGEIITADDSGSIYSSYGLLNSAAYRSYEGDDKPRWSVEIAESASYDARDKDWKILGTFNVRNELVE